MSSFGVKRQMKGVGLFIACGVLVTQFVFSQNRQAEPLKKIDGRYYVEFRGEDYQVNPSVVTVKFKSGVSQSKINLDTIRTNWLGYIHVAVPDSVDLVEFLDLLKNSNDFESVEYNSFFKSNSGFIPNDPQLSSQWYLDAVNMFDAWNITTGDPSVKVAVIDAGPHWGHSDIGLGNDGYTNVDTTLAWDFITNSNVITPYEHGTRILGQIGAKTNNAIGISGIAGGDGTSQGVILIPINIGISNTAMNGNVLDIAIKYAINNGAKIIQLSLSGTQSNAIDAAIAYAVQNNIVVVCAAGNNGGMGDPVTYPASLSDVISVGNMRQDYYRSSYSNYGCDLDVIAPGTDIWSTTINNGYNNSMGTSYAAPIVSAIISLCFSVNPSLTAKQVRDIIERSARKIRPNFYNYQITAGHPNGFYWEEVGYGLIDGYAAVYAAKHGILPNGNGVLFVKKGGSGTREGSSWANAHGDLATAIKAANVISTIREIWVADATYYPDSTVGFILPPNVKIYGGFPANADDWSHAKIINRPIGIANYGGTILSGDAYVTMTPSGSLIYTNHHVVVATENTYLDGFIITNGNASGTGIDVIRLLPNPVFVPRNKGGGVYATGNAALRNVEIRENYGQYGGGMAIAGGEPSFENIRIHHNSANNGGGMYFIDEFINKTELSKRVEIYENTASNGGGICIQNASIELNGGTIKRNKALNGGGISAISSRIDLCNISITKNTADNKGGGMYINNENQTCTLTNLLFARDTADFGGAIYADSGSCTIVNVSVSKNKDNISDMQGIANNNATLDVFNSILYDNTTSAPISNSNTNFYYSLVEGITTPVYVFPDYNLDGSTNPLFVSPASDDYQLSFNSPCRNKGNKSYTGQKVVGFDLAGNPRLIGPQVDMGAYENQVNIITPNNAGVLFVKKGGDGIQDGSSWADALCEFSTALQAANTNFAIREIWVANGFYLPDTNIGFILPTNNVRIYGGFPDTANDTYNTSIASRGLSIKDSMFGNTILSGDIGIPNDMFDNSYHVVVATGNSHLDGFIITSGNALSGGIDMINGILVRQDHGGGVYATENAELQNLIIRNNFGVRGGGMAVVDGCPRFENMYIYENSAGLGGGIYTENTSLYAKNVNIFENLAQSGGGIFCFWSPIMSIFENSSIHHNHAENQGGGICNHNSMPLFLNALIYDNTGADGAIIYNDPFATIIFVHATISNTPSQPNNITPMPMLPMGINFYVFNSIVNISGFMPSSNYFPVLPVPPIGFPFPEPNRICSSPCLQLFNDPNSGDYSLTDSLRSPYTINLPYMLSIIAPNSFLCNLPANLLQTDIVGNPRVTNGVSNYGAYEYDSSNPYYDHWNPFWKSIDNNQESEKILTKDGTNWKLRTYPNPTASGEQITVLLENGNLFYDNSVFLKLFSIDGSLLFNKTFSSGQFVTDIPKLASGIYIIRLQTQTGETYTGKLVVK